MANLTLLVLAAMVAATAAAVHGRPLDRETAAAAAAAAHEALLGLKTRGERILRVGEITKESVDLAVQGEEGDAAGGDSEAWSGEGGDGAAVISPALLAVLSSSDVSEKDVQSVWRHLEEEEKEA